MPVIRVNGVPYEVPKEVADTFTALHRGQLAMAAELHQARERLAAYDRYLCQCVGRACAIARAKAGR